MARSGTTVFDTVNTLSIWKAISAPGRPVSKYCERVSKRVEVLARKDSPVNHPDNALKPGHLPPGVYKRSWRHVPARTNSLKQVAFAVTNLAPHALIVEKGKPYVRRRQVFTWEHAIISQRLKKGGYRTKKRVGGGFVSTPVVHAWGYKARMNPTPAPRGGHRVLARSATTIARAEGLRRSPGLTVN